MTPTDTPTETATPTVPALFVRADELWTEPPFPRAGHPLLVGARLHNPHAFPVDVTVTFRIEHPIRKVDFLAAPVRASVPGAGAVVLGAAEPWAEPAAGAYELFAHLSWTDPRNGAGEATAHRTVEVFQEGEDAPGGKISVAAPLVRERRVVLALGADDVLFAAGPPRMALREMTPSLMSGGWEVVAATGWRPYAARVEWELADRAGAHVLEARFLSGNGSVTPAARRIVNYAPERTTLAAGAEDVYHLELPVGEPLMATVEAEKGDPDLYAWTPDATDAPSAASERGPGQDEAVTVPRAHGGLYTILVAARSDCVYRLEVIVGRASNLSAPARKQEGAVPMRPSLDLPPAVLPLVSARGDLNADSRFDAADLLLFAQAWAAAEQDDSYRCLGDLNADGAVNADDLVALRALRTAGEP